MSGPIAHVDLPCLLTVADMAFVSTMIDSISGHRDANDFWVINTEPIGGHVASEGRPFSMSIGRIDRDESSDDAARTRDEIQTAFGFRPMHNIGFVAMCNQKEDHRILGELCLWTLDHFGGAIDFGGALPTPLPPTSPKRPWWELNWGEVRTTYQQMISGMPGQIVESLYKPTQDRTWASHRADAEFLRAWLDHPNFRMVK